MKSKLEECLCDSSARMCMCFGEALSSATLNREDVGTLPDIQRSLAAVNGDTSALRMPAELGALPIFATNHQISVASPTCQRRSTHIPIC